MTLAGGLFLCRYGVPGNENDEVIFCMQVLYECDIINNGVPAPFGEKH